MADMALLRSVCRVYKDQRHASHSGLVGHKLSELIEAPGIMIMSLRLPNRCPVPDSREIFERYQGMGVFSLHDQSLGNSMVHVSGIPGHSPRKLLQVSLGALGSTLLKPAQESIRSLSGIPDLLAGMYLSITIYSKIPDSKINSKNIHRIIRRLFRDFYHNAEVEYIQDPHKIYLTPYPIHPGFLVISDYGRDKLPAFQGDQRDELLPLPGENTLIIDNSTIWPEFRSNSLISLVSFRNLRNGSDSELRGKAISLSDWVVDRLVDLNLVGLMHGKSCSGNIIAGFVEAMHSAKELLMLFRAWIKPDHQGLEHCT